MRAKNITDRFLAAPLQLVNFSASGNSNVVTAPITSLLNAAGNGGVSVPLQPSASNGLGVITSGSANRAKLYDATSGDQLQSGGVNVYGRLTEAGGVYTLSYFTTPDGGSETAFTFGATTIVNAFIFYRFDFARFPVDALASVLTNDLASDLAVAGGSGPTLYPEQLTVTATNTIAALTKTPTSAASVQLIVNGESHDSFGGANAAFSLSGKTITWNPAAPHTGYPITTDDRVVVRYLTNE